MSQYKAIQKMTVPKVLEKKGKEKLTMLTAYDYPSARLVDEAKMDMILVGDSLGTVIYGHENTLSVTLEEMLRHTEIVARASEYSLIIGDMPFLSYQVSAEQAVLSAGRFLKESKAHAVKLEGGEEMVPQISAIVRAGIPVVGHIGLTPQSIHAMGSYRMFGKTEKERALLLRAAIAVEKAGAFALVLECIEPELAGEITQALGIPTIGIGSGDRCDGQVLVFHDLVGLTLGHVPKFVRPHADVKNNIREALLKYQAEVKGPL